MPNAGIIGVSLAQQLYAGLPNPSIWGDCPGAQLNDDGRGYAHFNTFIGGGYNKIGSTVEGGIGSPLVASTSTTYNQDTSYPGVMDVVLPATSGDAFTVYALPMGTIAASSGRKMWAEVSFALTSPGNEGIFFGFGGLPTMVTGLIGTVETAATLIPISESLFGFASKAVGSVVQDFDVVYEKGTGGTVNTVATSVLNSTAFTQYAATNPNGGNWFPGGVLNYPSAPGNLAANGFVSLGLRYDGQQYISAYVNGILVAKQIVDSTIDQSTSMGVVFGVKANAATSYTTLLNFFRAAYQYIA